MCAYRDSKKWLLLAYIIELHTTTVTPQKSKLYVLTIARYLETQIGGLYRLSFQATLEYNSSRNEKQNHAIWVFLFQTHGDFCILVGQFQHA